MNLPSFYNYFATCYIKGPYRVLILSDNSHLFWLGPFRTTASKVALLAISLAVRGDRHFLHKSIANMRLYARNGFLRAHRHASYLTNTLFKARWSFIREASRREVTIDRCHTKYCPYIESSTKCLSHGGAAFLSKMISTTWSCISP
jgi:hypothetical protein